MQWTMKTTVSTNVQYIYFGQFTSCELSHSRGSSPHFNPVFVSIVASVANASHHKLLCFSDVLFSFAKVKSRYMFYLFQFNPSPKTNRSEPNEHTHQNSKRKREKLTQKWTTNKLLTCVVLFAFVFCYFWHFVHFIVARIIVFGAFLCEYFVSFIVASLSGPSQFIYMFGVQCTCFLSNWNDNVFVAFVHFISSLL